LQRDLKSIEDAGVQVVGISYDSPAVLKRFSDKANITFPLLSNPDSKTIDAYHIRNEAAKGKAKGIPNPGTFVLDREGVIRAKLFLEGYRDRHTTAALVEAARAVKLRSADGLGPAP
jgi:peroxiredoxin Q/BCP